MLAVLHRPGVELIVVGGVAAIGRPKDRMALPFLREVLDRRRGGASAD